MQDQSCTRGDACPYAHNVFEYWLHPTRYRTQLCNDGEKCARKICFFAHTLEELRVPANKPFVPPEALAAATTTATLEAARKAGAAADGPNKVCSHLNVSCLPCWTSPGSGPPAPIQHDRPGRFNLFIRTKFELVLSSRSCRGGVAGLFVYLALTCSYRLCLAVPAQTLSSPSQAGNDGAVARSAAKRVIEGGRIVEPDEGMHLGAETVCVDCTQAGLQMLSALLNAQPGNGENDLLKTLQAKVAGAQTAQVQI